MDLPIYFSRHALQRMRERRISEVEVVRAIEDPIQRTYNQGVTMVKALRKNGHLLMVVYREQDFMKVITVIDSSKLKKYLPL